MRLPKGVVERMKDITYHERILQNDFVTEAVSSHVGEYERKRDKPYPKRKDKK